MSSASYLYTNTYRGNSEINFFLDDNVNLTVTIDTYNLHLQSVDSSAETHNSYAALFSDQEVMTHFGMGRTLTRDEVAFQIDYYVKQWQANNPYGIFSIHVKNTDEFAGNILMGLGPEPKPGQAQLASGLSMKPYWNKKYGTEAAAAIVREYAPATIREGYMIDGKALDTITASVRPNNTATVQFLKNLGMHYVKEDEKLGFMLHLYSMKV